jgi:hypothetical protein
MKSFGFDDGFIDEFSHLMFANLLAAESIDKFSAIKEAKARDRRYLELLHFPKCMIRVFPSRLIANNKYIQWQFNFTGLLINGWVIRFGIYAIRAPVFAVLVFVAGK